MLVCAIDVRRRWIRLALVANVSGPEILETSCFSLDTGVSNLMELLHTWHDTYCTFTVVCCRSDVVPIALLEALEQAEYDVEWVAGQDVKAALGMWKSIGVEERWQRAGVMSFLLEKPLSSPCGESIEMAAWRWLYASLNKQLEDLHAWLGVEDEPTDSYGGRPYDPAHDARCWPSLEETAAESDAV